METSPAEVWWKEEESEVLAEKSESEGGTDCIFESSKEQEVLSWVSAPRAVC